MKNQGGTRTKVAVFRNTNVQVRPLSSKEISRKSEFIIVDFGGNLKYPRYAQIQMRYEESAQEAIYGVMT